ncbi:MAG: hypothetical protein WB791_03385 [Waddliaceae bacterium]
MLKQETRLFTVNIAVIAVTFFLFSLAIFVKGFKHDLLLEAAVFLVSVKLILTTFHIQILTQKIDEKIKGLEMLIKERKF